jgi:hypothetical protein
MILFFLFLAQILPTPLTPGMLNPAVNQGNIKVTICSNGWTKTVRPPAFYTNDLKLTQLTKGLQPKDYEEDHRIPLELGGNPTSPLNLWPEPWHGAFNAHNKDRLENDVRRDVCKGKLSLDAAQRIFLGDFWIEYKRRYSK